MSDYTRIDIAFDPTVQRMRGRTLHGGWDFDVPFISHIEGNLYLGGCQQGLILPGDFKHLVSLYPWERYQVEHILESELYVKAYDAEVEALADQLENLTRWTYECVKNGKTLVHCQAGLNRSSLVGALVLIQTGMAPAAAINLLRHKRSPAVLCNGSFERWLLGSKVASSHDGSG